MNHIVMNETLVAELALIPKVTEVRDAQGRLIGTFIPGVTVRSAVGDPPRSPFSDQDLSLREKDSARTLSEIWQSLGRK